jgi:cyclic pyranopterin phosphate synthase
LQYEEIIRLAEIFVDMGIKKIRITGGEPLVRKNILFLIEELTALRLRELVITTNGVLLLRYAEGLLKRGIKRVNVSLDSFNSETFRMVTGKDKFRDVIYGIEAANAVGIALKLNIVVMRGINDNEVVDFVRFALEKGIDLRFIEVMPQYYNKEVVRKRFIGSKEIIKKIAERYGIVPAELPAGESVERLYRIGDSEMYVGFISGISDPFCKYCNRVRLMANGVIKTCLFGPEGPNLKNMLREGASIEEIGCVIQEMIKLKPEKHTLDAKTGNLIMNRIGG